MMAEMPGHVDVKIRVEQDVPRDDYVYTSREILDEIAVDEGVVTVAFVREGSDLRTLRLTVDAAVSLSDRIAQMGLS